MSEKAGAQTRHAGIIGEHSEVLSLALTCDTVQYAAGDVLADTQELAGVMRIDGGEAMLRSLTLLDKDDQGGTLDVVFLRSNKSLGTENSAASISDANADEILGIVTVSPTDYADVGGAKVATKRNLELVLEAAATSRSIYVGAISRDTKTYTAAGLTLEVGVEQE